MATWQFVADMASASPTVLLDLNDGNPFWVGDGWDLSPANYSKGYAGSPLRHGSRLTNSRSENRTLTLPLQVIAANHTAAATAIQSLGLLLRTNGFLKYQPNGASNPQFFRYFADPDYAIEVTKTLTQQPKISLQLDAESFAYGPRVEVTGSPFTLSNNPAAGTNPMHFDISSVQGDVETPLFLIATSTGASNGLVSKWTHVATRRRGTPSGYSNVVQAEDMTQSNGAVVTADAAFSNGSKSRVTPVSNNVNLLRLADTFPGNGTATIEARGEYIVYARIAKTVAADPVTVQFAYGSSSASPIFNDAKTLPTANTGPWWVNLGKVPVPMYADPITHGFSGVQTKALLAFVGIYINRISGTTALDVDCLYFVPADESTVIVKWPSTDTTYVLDATTQEGGAAYAMPTTLDEVTSLASPPQIVGGGGFPELIPGATNRIHVVRQVDPAGTVDGITNTTTVRAYYWPRWREPFRP